MSRVVHYLAHTLMDTTTRPHHDAISRGVSPAPRSRSARGLATCRGNSRRVGIASAMALVLTACSATQSATDAITGAFDTQPAATTMENETSATRGWQQARIVAPSASLQCVAYARRVSGIAIRGDAWTWWRTAEGRYRKESKPAVGSILALKRTSRLRLGHVAVVTKILNDREIVVEHANWLNRGNIHKSTPVRDVSKANDWSAVRVWYTPGNRYGARTYRAHGFIHAGYRISALSLSRALDIPERGT